MTITLEVSQELEAELAAEAELLHLPLQDYLLRVLVFGRMIHSVPHPATEHGGDTPPQRSLPTPSILEAMRAEMGDNLPRTGAEIVAYWEREGLIGTRTDITDSVEYARELRRRAERRERS